MQDYSLEEINFIKENYSKMSVKDIAKYLNRTHGAIVTKANKMGVTKRHIWTEQEVELLKEKYPNTSNKTLSRLFNTPFRNIADKASELGLKKNSDCMFQCDLDLFLIKFEETYKNYEYAPLLSELTENDWSISVMSISRHFGGYYNLCKMFDLKPNKTIFNNEYCVYYSRNGDLCFSKAELMITDFFIDNNINYRKEVKYSEKCDDLELSRKISDWLINNEIFVEYFGMIDKDYYRIKTERKLELCKNNNINIIALYENDLNKLNTIFKEII